MTQPSDVDNALMKWGDRLFYPGIRIVKSGPQPRLSGNAARRGAESIRMRIEATIVRRAPQVMVKVTGGGRGMRAIAAHFRYISKNGRLDIEDEHGQKQQGKDAVRELAEDWRYGGSLIEDTSSRREAFNIILSMPRGTDPSSVQWAAREFAKTELTDHKYVMVLHDHQANPHVHLSVRAESKHGRRLNPRKTDLHRWREVFAEKLREHGIEAEATRQPTRGAARNYLDIWRMKAGEDGRLTRPRSAYRAGVMSTVSRNEAREAWRQIAAALSESGEAADVRLAAAIQRFTAELDRGGSRDVTGMVDRAGLRGMPSLGDRER